MRLTRSFSASFCARNLSSRSASALALLLLCGCRQKIHRHTGADWVSRCNRICNYSDQRYAFALASNSPSRSLIAYTVLISAHSVANRATTVRALPTPRHRVRVIETEPTPGHGVIETELTPDQADRNRTGPCQDLKERRNKNKRRKNRTDPFQDLKGHVVVRCTFKILLLLVRFTSPGIRALLRLRARIQAQCRCAVLNHVAVLFLRSEK